MNNEDPKNESIPRQDPKVYICEVNKYTRSVYKPGGGLKVVWNKLKNQSVVFAKSKDGQGWVELCDFDVSLNWGFSEEDLRWLSSIRKLISPKPICLDIDNAPPDVRREWDNMFRAQTATTGGVGITFEGPAKLSREVAK